MAEQPDGFVVLDGVVVQLHDVLARLDRLIADLQEVRDWLICELEDAAARAAR